MRNTRLDSCTNKVLEWDGDGEVARIVLREIEVAFGGGFNDAILAGGRLLRAAFDFWFAGAKKPRKVQVRPPNILKLGRCCDASVVQRWLSEKDLRETVGARA